MAKDFGTVDVLVVGGGAAGIAAAIGAARKGASVMLLEKSSQFGGKATQAVVGTICGAHYRSKEFYSKYVTEGFATEFCEAVRIASNTNPVAHYQGDLHFLPYHPFAFSMVADQLLAHEPAIESFLHATVQSLELKEGKIDTVHFLNFREIVKVQPRAIIDCTGESIVSQMCDAPLITEKNYQASAMVFSLENVKVAEPIKLSLAILRAVAKAISDKELREDFDKVSIVPGSLGTSNLMLKIALSLPVNSSTINKTQLEQLGREAVDQVSKVLIIRVEYFKNAHIGFVAPETGTRTGPLSEGKYTLLKEDVLECKTFEDGIAKGAWPIEMWKPGKNAALEFFPHDTHYEIPLRCLQSNTIENLYFAGRILSATHEAMASARVIGTCLSTGYAAGTAAAMQNQGHTTHQIIEQIRKEQVDR